MTPAEHLSAAATRLRDRADAATPGPWLGLPDWIDRDEGKNSELPEGPCVLSALGREVVGEWQVRGEDALFIAAMSPPVALALADWLEAETEHVASYDCMAHCEPAGCDRGHRALALAALIVPEAAEVAP